MSGLARLAGSVFALGFDGRSPAEAPLEELRAFGPGAVLLFARNIGGPDEVRALIGALRGLSDPPPLIAVDQEGGRVARFGDPVIALPSAMALGAAGDPALCEALGTRLGADLAALGVSLDLAPVLDLALDPDNTAIGTRAFGEDPERVAELGIAFARGLGRGGVAATLKHFPGHGATAVDSHRALPRIAADLETLRGRDLVPFVRAIAAGVAPAVMAAHVVVEALDPDLPASLSPRVVRGLLRDELGFDGLVCTDCLEMDAIAAGVGTVEGAVSALAAGADLLLVSRTPATAGAAARAIVAAVEGGRLAEERLRSAAERVAGLRARFVRPRPPAGAPPASLGREAARRGVTVLRGEPRLAPDRPVTVISFEGGRFDGAANPAAAAPSLSAELRARRRQSELMRVALEPDPEDVALLVDELAALRDREIVLVVRRAHRHPRQRAAVARILERAPAALVVSALEPYDALLWPAASRAICIYGDDRLALGACADVLTGSAEAGGRLPLRVDAVR